VYLLRLVRWLDQEAGDCRLSRLDIQVVVARRGFLLDQAMPFVRSCCSARVNHDTPDVRAEDCLLVILGQLQRRDSHLDFYVESVGLSPAYQAKGIMTRLFLRICRWLYQCDSDSVLSGIPEHIAAARFYEPKKSLSCGPSGRLAVSQLSCFALPIAQVLKRHRQKSACLA
jgi:GNAT superfamily N-acetyltransferase